MLTEKIGRPEADDAPAGPRGARRCVAGGLAGLVMVGGALLGSGTAQALDCSPIPAVGTLLYSQCKAAGLLTGTVTSAAKAAPQSATSAAAAVPKAVPSVVPKATKPVTGAVTAVTGGASSAPSSATGSQSGSSSSSTPAARSSSAAAAPAATAVAPAAAPSAAPQTYRAMFDSLPASFLGSAAPGSLTAFSGLGGAYDPGLLTSATPYRVLPAGRVTTSSSALPISFLSDGRIGTPVLLSVLSVAVAGALAVRAGVLRRARRRHGGATA